MRATTIQGALRRTRRLPLARMLDTCIIRRPGPLDTDENGDVSQESETVYEGVCYTNYPGLAWEQVLATAGLSVTASRIVVTVPFGVAFEVGDLVTIVAAPDNPQLERMEYLVMSIDDASQKTAQHLLCIDAQAGVSSE